MFPEANIPSILVGGIVGGLVDAMLEVVAVKYVPELGTVLIPNVLHLDDAIALSVAAAMFFLGTGNIKGLGLGAFCAIVGTRIVETVRINIIGIGMGMASSRRFGQPLTDAERAARHYELYGTTELPPRGTGFMRRLTRMRA